MAAPVTVIIAYDLRFYDNLPRLFPHCPAMRDMFVNNPQLIQETALRNSTLQGAYMILAARALGLDSGPMSGFDNAKLDEEFFAAGKCGSCEQEFARFSIMPSWKDDGEVGKRIVLRFAQLSEANTLIGPLAWGSCILCPTHAAGGDRRRCQQKLY